MNKKAHLLVLLLVLVSFTAGCSLTYKANYVAKGYEVSEYGLVGLPVSETSDEVAGLIPLWRKAEPINSAPKGNLKILNARYGAEGKWVDVTEILNSKIKDGRLSVMASNDLAGDPIFQTEKELKIEYLVGDKSYSETVYEDNMVTLP